MRVLEPGSKIEMWSGESPIALIDCPIVSPGMKNDERYTASLVPIKLPGKSLG